MDALQNAYDRYIEYTNDFITIPRYAEHHNISVEVAEALISLGASTFRMLDEAHSRDQSDPFNEDGSLNFDVEVNT